MKRKSTFFLAVLCFSMSLQAISGCGIAKTPLTEQLEHNYSGIYVTEQMVESIQSAQEEIPNDTEEKNLETGSSAQSETSEEENKAEVKVESVSKDRYFYNILTPEVQLVYDQVFASLMEMQENTMISTTDPLILEQAYKAIMADHGEIYWTSGYIYTQYTKGDTVVEMEVSPKYTMTAADREQYDAQIAVVVEQIVNGIDQNASDYDKAKYVFDYLASEVAYQLDAPNNQNIISVFLQKATVCQGYACATQYLLKKLGIQSAIITGNANGESHAWNLVRLDDAYYYMDTTWGNSTYSAEVSEIGKYINYSYFAVTSEELERTHTPNEYYILPECTATEDNYFVREGLFFEEWNPELLGSIFQTAYQNAVGMISIRFATEELYQQALQYFIQDQHISDYCEGITSLYYLEEPEQKVLTMKFHI